MVLKFRITIRHFVANIIETCLRGSGCIPLYINNLSPILSRLQKKQLSIKYNTEQAESSYHVGDINVGLL
jgi:hypothetical protein